MQRKFSLTENNRGLWCPYRASLFCSEGYCESCQIYLDYRAKLRDIAEENLGEVYNAIQDTPS